MEFGCTAKGRKEGQTNLNFMVAIAHSKGVVLCERYHRAITGQKMADLVDEHFEMAFQRSADPRGRRFLMDNCPRQISKTAMKAYDRVNGIVFRIPPRSPDLNPIEVSLFLLRVFSILKLKAYRLNTFYSNVIVF